MERPCCEELEFEHQKEIDALHNEINELKDKIEQMEIRKLKECVYCRGETYDIADDCCSSCGYSNEEDD